jgi:cytochrome c-type biogenesis protein CcmH/NrfG
MDKTDYRKAQYYLKQVIALDPANRKNTQLLATLDDLLAR